MPHFSYRRLFKLAKGFYGKGKNCISVALPRVDRALKFAYTERRLKKRTMRKEWIMSINAGVREHGIPYNRFIYGLTNSNIELDRKILSSLCQYEPLSFKALIDEIKVQTGLGFESRKSSGDSFENAVKEGVIVMPDQTLPPLEQVYEDAKGKTLEWRKGFEETFVKTKRPPPEKIQQMIEADIWFSDDEDKYEDQPAKFVREKMKGEPEPKAESKPKKTIYDPAVNPAKKVFKIGAGKRQRTPK